MKASLKIQFIILFMLPFIACASFYTFTMLTEQYAGIRPGEDTLTTITTSDDIEKIRDYALTYMKGYIDTQQSNTKVHYSFVQFLFVLAILNTILLYSIFKSVQQTTGEKNKGPDA